MKKSETKTTPFIIQEQTKILIVEDNEINMLLTKALVGHIVPNALLYEAHDGKEGVNKMLELSPDLILMDVQMPIMDGLEATRLIRRKRKGKKIPIIAITTSNMKGDKERCLEAGMNDFINKPVVEKTLKEVLEKWIKQDGPAEKVHVNFTTIHIYTLDDKEFEKEFISLIIKSINEALQNFYLYIGRKNLKAIKVAAHKLRGAAATAGLAEINHIAAQMEKQQIFEYETMKALTEELEAEIKIVGKILSAYLKE